MYTEFCKKLRDKRIEITFDKGKLQYCGPEESIDEEIIINLRRYKQNLIKDYWPSDCYHIMPINTEGNKIPLILIHVGDFADVVTKFEFDRPVYGLYLLGSQGEKNNYKTVEEYAEVYLKQLLKIVPKGPFYLGGFSFGGVVAYEMAVRLIKMGHEVPALIIGDANLNSKKKKKIIYQQVSKKIYYTTKNILTSVYSNVGIFYKTIKKSLFPSLYYNSNIQERARYMVSRFILMIKRYKPTITYEGQTILYKSIYNKFAMPYLNWDKVCKNISLEFFEGTHNDMFQDKNVSNFIKVNIQNLIKKLESKELESKEVRATEVKTTEHES